MRWKTGRLTLVVVVLIAAVFAATFVTGCEEAGLTEVTDLQGWWWQPGLVVEDGVVDVVVVAEGSTFMMLAFQRSGLDDPWYQLLEESGRGTFSQSASYLTITTEEYFCWCGDWVEVGLLPQQVPYTLEDDVLRMTVAIYDVQYNVSLTPMPAPAASYGDLVGVWSEDFGPAELTFGSDGAYSESGGDPTPSGFWAVTYHAAQDQEYFFLHITTESEAEVDYYELHPFEYPGGGGPDTLTITLPAEEGPTGFSRQE